MKIADNAVVTLEYSLHLGDGVIIDQSGPGQSLAYVHGQGNIVPGLEKALAGLEPGAKGRFEIAPDQGYGERDERLLQHVARSAFRGQKIVAGDEFVAEQNGHEMPGKIIRVGGEKVTVDFNHPLAGKTLHFSIEVKDVREATAEELSHGHVHGEHGHHH